MAIAMRNASAPMGVAASLVPAMATVRSGVFDVFPIDPQPEKADWVR